MINRLNIVIAYENTGNVCVMYAFEEMHHISCYGKSHFAM